MATSTNKRRRSDRFSSCDQALKRKLEQGTWTRQELEWVLCDERLPLILAAIINGKLRQLETAS